MAMLSSSGSHAVHMLVCKICGQKFLEHERPAAEAHVRSAHPEASRKALGCRICGEKFLESETQEIIEHMRTRHPREFADLLHRLGVSSG